MYSADNAPLYDVTKGIWRRDQSLAKGCQKVTANTFAFAKITSVAASLGG
jgi:hypothetical protein